MSTTDQLLDNAFESYNAANYERAEELAREVLTLVPNHGDALYLLGLIAFQANALEPASKILYEAVKLYPNTENYALALASILQRQNHYDEALSFYEKYKKSPNVLSQMGLIYAQKGDISLAKTTLDNALKINETDTVAWIALSDLAKKDGDLTKAEKILLTALEKSPNADVFYHLAMLARQDNELDKALTYINQAIKLQSQAMYMNEYGLILEQTGDLEGALEKYIQAMQLNPYYADAYANQGNIYLKQGEIGRAEDAYKRALAQDRDYLAAHHNLAVLLFEQGRKAESLGHYQEAIIINPQHVPSIYNLAMILEDMGEYLEATGLYFNALVLGLKNKELDLRIAATLTKLYGMGQVAKKQAQEFAKGWVKNFPDNPVAKHTLAALSRKKGTDVKSYAHYLFDAFADTYDTTMQKLQCTAIEKTIGILSKKTYKSVLDLACGTGQFALAFKGRFKSITGVDISENMIKKAYETNLYKKLINEPIDTYLDKNKQTFELIVAIELMGYIDKPLDLFQRIKNHLNPNSHFVFTIETTEKNSELSTSGRYLYSYQFIEKKLLQAGMKVITHENVDLRKEGSGVAKGEVILASLV